MVRNSFDLKRSRFEIAFQMLIFLLIVYFLYQVLSPVFLILSLIVLLVSYFYFFKKEKFDYFARLDDDIWSLRHRTSKKIERVELDYCIDHQFYIVFYFKDHHQRSLVIWRDQLNSKQWKALKVYVNLN